jgi:hypothetical protein
MIARVDDSVNFCFKKIEGSRGRANIGGSNNIYDAGQCFQRLGNKARDNVSDIAGDGLSPK